jgi:Tfp pilus assembly protein PilF
LHATEEVEMKIFSELLRRRVSQILGIYLAVGWGVLEFTDWLVNRYLLSPHLLDFSLVAWATMIPTVLLLAWFHGAPGADTWTRAETVGIPANLVGAAVVLFAVFSGKDLGAATASVTIENEAGETVERVVPKAEFRKSVAIFYFEEEAGDTALHWLRYGIPGAISLDLTQDLFLDIRDTPVFLERLRQEGFADGLNVPFVLKREIAGFLHLPHFVTGTISRDGDQLAVFVSVYETRRGKLLSEKVYTGDDIFELSDGIAVQLKRDLQVPEHHIEETTDLPVSEILTASEDAYRSYIDGSQAFAIEVDYESAALHWERAVELDPQFAMAYLGLFSAYTSTNQAARGEQAIEAAMGLLYKLTERAQATIKAIYYWIVRQDMAKALAAAEMRAELFPHDINAHLLLVQLYAVGDNIPGAIAALERVVDLDPSRIDMLLQIGQLYESEGEFETALANYRRYAEESPNDPRSFVRLGDLSRRIGEHEAARADYNKALVIDTTRLGRLPGGSGCRGHRGAARSGVYGTPILCQPARAAKGRRRLHAPLLGRDRRVRRAFRVATGEAPGSGHLRRGRHDRRSVRLARLLCRPNRAALRCDAPPREDGNLQRAGRSRFDRGDPRGNRSLHPRLRYRGRSVHTHPRAGARVRAARRLPASGRLLSGDPGARTQ